MTAIVSIIRKNFRRTAMLLMALSLVSCFRSATPDDDLVSGIFLGDIAEVQRALDHGANPGRILKDGTTPLMYACREFKNYHGEAGAGVKVEVKADFDNSKTSMDVQAGNAHASHSAHTVKGNPQIVKLLIERGADANARDKEGQTALSFAIRNNMPEIVEILRKAGAKE